MHTCTGMPYTIHIQCGPSMRSWVYPHPFIESIHTLLRRRVWIDSRRHWRSTLYVVVTPKLFLFLWNSNKSFAVVMFVQNKRLGSHQTLICMQYTMYMNWKANNLLLEPNCMREDWYIIHCQENYCMFASIFFNHCSLIFTTKMMN